MQIKKSIVLGSLALGLIGSGSVALAANSADDNTTSSTTAATAAISRDKAIEIAKTKLAGTVKQVEFEAEHGKAVWKVRIISTDGLKRGDIRVDANTGDVLRVKIKGLHGNKAAKLEEKKMKFEAKMEKKKAKLEAKIAKKKAKLEAKAAKKSGKIED